MTNEPERRLLLRLAREAIAAHVTGGRMAAQSGMGMPADLLARPCGVFVSIHKDGDLRQQIMDRTYKAELDKDPERKGYGVLVRIDKIRGYSGFNVVQER